MGETFINFLGGSPLNRLSWLRSSQSFLNAVIASPTTRWILFREGQPLISSHTDSQKRALAYLATAEVKPLLGAEPYFGQGQQEGEHCATDVSILEAARIRGPGIVFLGLLEDSDSSNALPSSDFKDPQAAVAKLEGTPFFSLDVTDVEEGAVNSVVQGCNGTRPGETLAFVEPRSAANSLDASSAAIFAEARSMSDWNHRNQFCAACGSPVYSLWAGWKLSCSSLLPWADNTGKKPCPSGRGLQNFAHPRTDPVIIVCIVDESGEKILLGRNRKFPAKFYSCLAGFIEPGESFEDAVKREMWEEAGIKVRNIRYHSAQPWPYPANLMVGFYASADSSAPIRTDLDNELEDARWYTREEVLAVLSNPSGTNFTRRDYKKMNEIAEGKPDTTDKQQGAALETTTTLAEEPSFKMPGATAIAGILIEHWALRKIEQHVNSIPLKGSL